MLADLVWLALRSPQLISPSFMRAVCLYQPKDLVQGQESLVQGWASIPPGRRNSPDTEA